MTLSSRATLTLAATLAVFPLSAYAQGAGNGLPEGNGKELVATICTGCHQTDMITRSSGYSAEHWKELTGTMINLSPSPETQNEILDYLAQKFPPNHNRAAKIVPGPMEVTEGGSAEIMVHQQTHSEGGELSPEEQAIQGLNIEPGDEGGDVDGDDDSDTAALAEGRATPPAAGADEPK